MICNLVLLRNNSSSIWYKPFKFFHSFNNGIPVTSPKISHGHFQAIVLDWTTWFLNKGNIYSKLHFLPTANKSFCYYIKPWQTRYIWKLCSNTENNVSKYVSLLLEDAFQSKNISFTCFSNVCHHPSTCLKVWLWTCCKNSI